VAMIGAVECWKLQDWWDSAALVGRMDGWYWTVRAIFSGIDRAVECCKLQDWWGVDSIGGLKGDIGQ